MTTSPLTGTGSSSSSSSTAKAGNLALTSQDFIKMMVTQLQNQDPLQPTSNSELLSQMSQIGQLQSATDLQSSLKTMVLQNQIGAAGNLIGKTVAGVDDSTSPVSGVVTSVTVANNTVSLNLDNGKTLGLNNVTTIAGVATATAATAGAASTATTPATHA